MKKRLFILSFSQMIFFLSLTGYLSKKKFTNETFSFHRFAVLSSVRGIDGKPFDTVFSIQPPVKEPYNISFN